MPVSLLLRSSVALAALAVAVRRPRPADGHGPRRPEDLHRRKRPGRPVGRHHEDGDARHADGDAGADAARSASRRAATRPRTTIPKQDNCRVTDMKTVGNKVTFTMECTGEEPMSMRGEITSTPTSYDGRMSMKGTRKGENMDMTHDVLRAGASAPAPTRPSRSSRRGKSQDEAQIAQGLHRGHRQVLVRQSSARAQVCATRKKAFCDKMGGHRRHDARTRGLPRRGRRNPASPPVRGLVRGLRRSTWSRPRKPACGKAVGSKDWAFVGNGVCDAEVRAQGPTYCKGRDYYLVDRRSCRCATATRR